MEQEESIESIQYTFNDEELRDQLNKMSHDLDGSIAQYKILCGSSLRDYYPTVKQIQIEGGVTASIRVNSRIDHPDVEFIKDIFFEVWDSGKWKVPLSDNDRIGISEANEIFQVPVAIIRWGCENQLIKDAKKRDRRWTFSRRAFLDFQNVHLRGSMLADLWEIKRENGVEICSAIEVIGLLNRPLNNVQGMQIVIVPISLDLPQPLSVKNCSLFLSVGEEEIKSRVTIFEDVEYWGHPEHTFGNYCNKVKEQAKEQGHSAQVQQDVITIEFHIQTQTVSWLQKAIDCVLVGFRACVESAEIILDGGPEWKDEYMVHEKPFCDELLEKLLHQMKFYDIENKHGNWEFGKDFTFTERTFFGLHRYYGMQAKAGNISGAINPQPSTKTSQGKRIKVTPLDEILAQLEDAFTIPYRYKETSEPRFISTFIIAISGELTENAKEKLWWKLQKAGRLGMVYVWDRKKIEELIRIYWLESNKVSDKQEWWVANDLLTYKDTSKE